MKIDSHDVEVDDTMEDIQDAEDNIQYGNYENNSEEDEGNYLEFGL